jgi:hypothetical protein
MSKSTVTWLFGAGVVAIIAGIVLELAAVLVALAGGVFTFGGAAVVTFNGGASAWLLVGLAILGFLAFAGGGIAGLVSWIGALLNTYKLEDKTWFILLLVLGLLSFGFVAMVVYVFVGPDGMKREAALPAMAASSQS